MDLRNAVPSWDELERRLDGAVQSAGKSLHSGWDSISQDVQGGLLGIQSGLDSVYGRLGGRQVDCLRRALTATHSIAFRKLARRFADIQISQVLDLLLKLARDVALVMAGSIATGAALGAAVGALGFGVGAAPGAVAGAGLGFEVGNMILAALGLTVLAEYFVSALPSVLRQYKHGIGIAWNAAQPGIGMDPSGSLAAREEQGVQQATYIFAEAHQQVVVLLLMALVAYLTRGQVRAGLVNGAERIAARSAQLQSQIQNRQLANWLAANEQKLLAQPELRPRETPQNSNAGQAESLREHYARQDPGFTPVEEQIAKVKTFETHGLSNAQIDDYLASPDGGKLIDSLRAADPKASAQVIYERAAGQLASGSSLPEVRLLDSPLVKIVPEGQTVSPYSPFFTTRQQLDAAASSGKSLADAFGLPLGSEAPSYSIYQISPLKPTEVFVSPVAPTSELGGTIQRSGGALQFLTPNRGEWSSPKLIGTIGN